MRSLVLFVTVALSATPVFGQSSVRSSGSARGNPGRVSSPLPPSPHRGASTVKPAVPDARLGAGGIRPNTGNIVYPGTPGVSSVGNILTPGTPSGAHPIPPIVPQPVARPTHPASPGAVKHKHSRGHGRRYAGDYPVYGFFAYPFVPNVIAVEGSTMTRSGSGYVVTVGDEEPAEQTAEIAPAETAKTDYWLIALRGGLIYAVSDYSIESRALRFVTLQGDEYVVPLAELDRDFTVKLNQDRNVQIELD